jgi:hypothetical protein
MVGAIDLQLSWIEGIQLAEDGPKKKLPRRRGEAEGIPEKFRRG